MLFQGYIIHIYALKVYNSIPTHRQPLLPSPKKPPPVLITNFLTHNLFSISGLFFILIIKEIIMKLASRFGSVNQI